MVNGCQRLKTEGCSSCSVSAHGERWSRRFHTTFYFLFIFLVFSNWSSLVQRAEHCGLLILCHNNHVSYLFAALLAFDILFLLLLLHPAVSVSYPVKGSSAQGPRTPMSMQGMHVCWCVCAREGTIDSLQSPCKYNMNSELPSSTVRHRKCR